MKSVHVLGLTAINFVITGCSSIQYEPVQNRTSHFMCFDQNKATKHYFTNTFAIEPTLEQKRNELLLVKLRMEKQLQIKLTNCQKIDESEVPKDFDLTEF